MKVLIACVIAFMLGSFIGAAFGVGKPASQQASIRAYNDHWQRVQDAKMMICYQKIPTMELVIDCMLKSDVFI